MTSNSILVNRDCIISNCKLSSKNNALSMYFIKYVNNDGVIKNKLLSIRTKSSRKYIKR